MKGANAGCDEVWPPPNNCITPLIIGDKIEPCPRMPLARFPTVDIALEPVLPLAVVFAFSAWIF